MSAIALKYAHPIRKGFPRSIGMYFADRVTATGIELPVDLSLYSPRLAVKFNDNPTIIIPTVSVPVPAEGWAIFTFSAIQSTSMAEGIWKGNGLLIKVSDGSISHELDIEITVKTSVVAL
jgi:hypothetical protein